MKATSYQFSGLSTGAGLSGGKVQNVNVSGNKKKTNSVKKSNQNKMPKKHLNYNPREIRNALLPAPAAAGSVRSDDKKAPPSDPSSCDGVGG